MDPLFPISQPYPIFFCLARFNPTLPFPSNTPEQAGVSADNSLDSFVDSILPKLRIRHNLLYVLEYLFISFTLKLPYSPAAGRDQYSRDQDDHIESGEGDLGQKLPQSASAGSAAFRLRLV